MRFAILLCFWLNFGTENTTFVSVFDAHPFLYNPLTNMAQAYKPILSWFMSFVNNEVYANDHEFTDAQLGALTPNDVLHWMNVQTFGIPNPAPDANPTLAQSNTLKYWKKALSFFMPNKLMLWNRISNQGNPTRSTEIDDLIKRVKKKEVRKQAMQEDPWLPKNSDFCTPFWGDQTRTCESMAFQPW